MEFIQNHIDNSGQGPTCPVCFLNRINIYLIKNGYFLRQCCECGFIFVWPLPQDTENLYTKEYFYKDSKTKCVSGYTDYEKDKASMKDVFYKYLIDLEKFTKGRKIFDVGAATGYFLDLAKTRGWQTGGNELSSHATGIARNKGHNVFAGDLTKMDMYENYDVITMWDVLEHVKNPQKNLISANKILSSEGILAINTVDRKSLWARFWGKKWSMIVPPEHLYYFDSSSLTTLLKRAGFDIVAIKKIGKRYSIPYIFKTLCFWRGGLFWKKMTQFFSTPIWRKFSIPINLRDNIFVVARKTKNI